MPTGAKRKRRSADERLADLKAKKDQLNARIKDEEAKVRAAARKQDTRCKIVAGALAIANCQHDAEFAAKFRKLITDQVDDPVERERILSRL